MPCRRPVSPQALPPHEFALAMRKPLAYPFAMSKREAWDRIIADAKAAGFLKFLQDGVAVLHAGDGSKEESVQKEIPPGIREYMAKIGAKGGKAGTGSSKSRPSDVARKAVNARWAKRKKPPS